MKPQFRFADSTLVVPEIVAEDPRWVEALRDGGDNPRFRVVPDAQYSALLRVHERWGLPDTVKVEPDFGGDAILVPVTGMWLGVEPDGYTHS